MDPQQEQVIAEARVPGTAIFFLGCFASRVTVLSQQRRALNLVDAILEAGIVRRNGRVAIVGGGASGITAAAAFALGGRELQTIDLFERRNKLLHLQVNSDRYLHPHLYDWPAPDSTRAHAGLPILDWSADEAGAIANKILTEFREIEARSPNLRVKTQQSVKNVMALGRVGCRVEVEGSSVEGGRYDAAVIAIGFGYELETTGENKTYWAPSPLPGALHCELPSGQFPVLFVSGNGDGGLVDFTMASFDRMTHTEITDFVTGYRDLEGTQNALLEIEKQA